MGCRVQLHVGCNKDIVSDPYDVFIQERTIHIDDCLFADENMLPALAGEIQVNAGMLTDAAKHLAQNVHSRFAVCYVCRIETHEQPFGLHHHFQYFGVEFIAIFPVEESLIIGFHIAMNFVDVCEDKENREAGQGNHREDTRKEQTVRQTVHTRGLRTAVEGACCVRPVRARERGIHGSRKQEARLLGGSRQRYIIS